MNKLDRIQSKVLEGSGVDEEAALMNFNLAPLATRRDIAMLGVVHRRVIGKCPPHFKDHFTLEPGKKLKDPRATLKGPMVVRSFFEVCGNIQCIAQNMQRNGNSEGIPGPAVRTCEKDDGGRMR